MQQGRLVEAALDQQPPEHGGVPRLVCGMARARQVERPRELGMLVRAPGHQLHGADLRHDVVVELSCDVVVLEARHGTEVGAGTGIELRPPRRPRRHAHAIGRRPQDRVERDGRRARGDGPTLGLAPGPEVVGGTGDHAEQTMVEERVQASPEGAVVLPQGGGHLPGQGAQDLRGVRGRIEGAEGLHPGRIGPQGGLVALTERQGVPAQVGGPGDGALHQGGQCQLLGDPGHLGDPAGGHVGGGPLERGEEKDVLHQACRGPAPTRPQPPVGVGGRRGHSDIWPSDTKAWPQGQHPASAAKPGPLSAPVGRPAAPFSADPRPEATPGERSGPLPR